MHKDSHGKILKAREVGEIFQDGNTTLKVEIGYTCTNCFYRPNPGFCNAIRSITGECTSSKRNDGKEISFKKIESNKKEIMRDVILITGIPNPNGGDNYLKIQTVKFVKDALGLGLKEAKELVDAMPSVIAKEVTDEEAGNLIKVFEKEGMKIEVKDSFTSKLVYPTKVPDFEETDSIAEVKVLKERIKAGEDSISEGKPHYWIMGTPNRGDDVYDLLHDKDPLLQLKINVSKEMLENPSRLLWINDSHEINAISVKDNVSLVNLITKSWTELELPWKPEDKELVWASDDDTICMKSLVFYDDENNCAFTGKGCRDGAEYDNYAPFEGELPEWAKEALKRLEN